MPIRGKSSDKTPGFCHEIPAAFSSLEEARNSMDFHWNTCINLLTDMEPSERFADNPTSKPELQERRRQFSAVVNDWLTAFQAFFREHGMSLDKKGLQAARSLEISYIFCSIYLDLGGFSESFSSEMMWDKFLVRYERVVELASFVVNPTDGDYTTQRQCREFSLDLNIVAPMYAVAHRCRDPIIRRKAVAILYAAPRQEGVWDGVLTARVAEKVISIEEAGLGPITGVQDVPDWARIDEVHVKFDLQDRSASLTYNRRRSTQGDGRETVMETISW